MMNATKYADVLETKLLFSARSLFRQDSWISQVDIAHCHLEKLVKNGCKAIEYIRWTGQHSLQV